MPTGLVYRFPQQLSALRLHSGDAGPCAGAGKVIGATFMVFSCQRFTGEPRAGAELTFWSSIASPFSTLVAVRQVSSRCPWREQLPFLVPTACGARGRGLHSPTLRQPLQGPVLTSPVAEEDVKLQGQRARSLLEVSVGRVRVTFKPRVLGTQSSGR